MCSETPPLVKSLRLLNDSNVIHARTNCNKDEARGGIYNYDKKVAGVFDGLLKTWPRRLRKQPAGVSALIEPPPAASYTREITKKAQE